MSPPSSWSKKQSTLCLLPAFTLVSCLVYSSTLKRHVPRKRRLTFNGLQGVKSQKTKLFEEVRDLRRSPKPEDAVTEVAEMGCA
jgi:hypothetical protein